MILHTCTKVNIGLHVLRRRADGYHDLETLFVPYYGYSDTLVLEPSDSCSIEIERAGGVDWDPQKDLTMQAWRLLKADFPQMPCVAIRLEKHAPIGAGLGGGSADAAFALKGFNTLFGLGLGEGDLERYAARLGSDCAFFVRCRPMLGSGRGEVLEPFDPGLDGLALRVEVPLAAGSGKPVAVSTREAYAGVTPSEGRPPLRELLSAPVEKWRGLIVNDFEASVCPAHPEISSLIQRFYDSGAVYAAMSGSGSAVFGLFRK